jgi:hypothetical protein
MVRRKALKTTGLYPESPLDTRMVAQSSQGGGSIAGDPDSMGRTDKTLEKIFPGPLPFPEFPERPPYLLEAPILAPSLRMEK